MNKSAKSHYRLRAEPGTVTVTGQEVWLRTEVSPDAARAVRVWLTQTTLSAKGPTLSGQADIQPARKSHSISAVPAVGELLIYALAGKKQREAVLGDAEEQFQANLAKGYSLRRAQWLYWLNLRDLVWPTLKRWGGRGLYIAMGWATARWGRPG